MRRKRKSFWDVTTYEEYSWVIAERRWCTRDDASGKDRCNTAFPFVKTKRRAFRLARQLKNLGCNRVTILHWTWHRGVRFCREYTLNS